MQWVEWRCLVEGMNFKIKHLQEQDWKLWKEIRLEALKLHPEAFGSSYEEESLWEQEKFKQGLVKNNIFGAFIKDKLVGVAGFSIYNPQKLRHKGMLFTLYVKKESRNQGIANQLVEAVISYASSKVFQVHCSVNTGNNQAIKLYKKQGFEIFGTETRALKVDENFYDLHLMLLKIL